MHSKRLGLPSSSSSFISLEALRRLSAEALATAAEGGGVVGDGGDGLRVVSAPINLIESGVVLVTRGRAHTHTHIDTLHKHTSYTHIRKIIVLVIL